MKTVFLIRYGEIGLKGQNRALFEDALERNIRLAIKSADKAADFGKSPRIGKSYGRFFISDIKAENETTYLETLSSVPGIVGISRSIAVENSMDEIKTAAVFLMKQAVNGLLAPTYEEGLSGKTISFKVQARRPNKQFPIESPEVNKQVGGAVLESVPGVSVDVHSPRVRLTVEIRQENTYVYTEEKPGPGGLPVGTAGKGMLLISGGIDSPVAGYMAMKRGVELHAVHFWSYPITGERSRDKVVEICSALRRFNQSLRMYIAPFTKIQTEIMEKCPEKYRVTIMRRMMMRVASKLALELGCLALFTGESLGQVASQTMESLKVIEDASSLPILRPLICFDKVEIIEKARAIDTYELSCLPYEDCCSVFVPKHPVTKPRIEHVTDAEKPLSVDDLVNECIQSVYEINLNPKP